MRFRRLTLACLLLTVLTVGGVLAPLSHLVYMAVSDAYAPRMVDTGQGHSDGQHAMTPADADHASWQATQVLHLSCPYAALFATPLFGDTTLPAASVPFVHRATVLQAPVQASWQGATSTAYPVRGPPFSTSLV